MLRNLCKSFLVTCLLSVPAVVNAQSNINREGMVNKTWHIVAMKCPDKVGNATDEAQFIHYYATLRMKPSNMNNINYGTYERVNRDASDNPKETGTYSITYDDANNTRLILKATKGGSMEYFIDMVSENYLTLIRQGEDDKCRVAYAIAP